MTRPRTLLAALAAACALAGMLAASASATVGPTLLFTPSTAGPTVLLNIKPETVIATKLESTTAVITGKKLSLEITLLAEKGVLEGIYLAKFYEVEIAGTGECHTSGAASPGEIEVGEKGKSEIIKVIYINKTTATLAVGEVFEVSDLTVLCGTGPVEVLLKGNVLGTINPLNKKIAIGSNTIEGGLHCSSTTGVPSITHYTNSKGEAATTELKVGAGGTNAKACELIGSTETEVVKLLPNKEIELMG